MRKTKEQKAITLIALIITIVVLLILAVVAINSVTGDGIIQHAVNAKEDYEKAQVEEESVLSYYEDYLVTEGKAGTWKQEGEYIINSDEVKIPIGATVAYDPSAEVANIQKLTYTSSAAKTGMVENQVFKTSSTSTETLTWKILGEENGRIMLIASTGIAPVESEDSNVQSAGYALAGKDAYNNAVEEINNACAIYGHGNGAESARSINASDIERIAGITQAEKEKEVTTTYSYGHKYSYEYTEGNVELSEDGGTSEELGITQVYFPDGIINSENPGPKSVTTNQFSINLENRIKISDLKDSILNGEATWIPERVSAVVDITITSPSGAIIYPRGYIIYGMKVIDSRNGSSTKNYYTMTPLYTSEDKIQHMASHVVKVRPIVILEKDTVLTESNGVYNISK